MVERLDNLLGFTPPAPDEFGFGSHPAPAPSYDLPLRDTIIPGAYGNSGWYSGPPRLPLLDGPLVLKRSRFSDEEIERIRKSLVQKLTDDPEYYAKHIAKEKK